MSCSSAAWNTCLPKDVRFAITGAEGMLGTAFSDALKGLLPEAQVLTLSHRDCDVTEPSSLTPLLRFEPHYVIHCAAYTRVDDCESRRDLADAVNVDGARNVALVCKQLGATLVYPQTFLCLGESPQGVSYDEAAQSQPLNYYATSKYEGERACLATGVTCLVVRKGGLFGGFAKDKNFVGAWLRGLATKLAAGERDFSVGNRIWQPTYARDVADQTLLLLEHRQTGLFNVASHGSCSFFELATECCSILRLPVTLSMIHNDTFAGTEPARRPFRVEMSNTRLQSLGLDRQRHWKHSLTEYLAHPYFTELFREYSHAI